MIAVQIGIIIFLVFILAIVYQDEHKRRLEQRKSAKLSSFWNDGKERRKNIRINTKIDVLYEAASGRQVQKRTSTTRNISLGGINLAINERLLPGAILKLQLNLPESHRPIFTQGKIIWIREISERFSRQKEQRLFTTGIKFIQVKPNDEAVLRSFISQRIKNTTESGGS